MLFRSDHSSVRSRRGLPEQSERHEPFGTRRTPWNHQLQTHWMCTPNRYGRALAYRRDSTQVRCCFTKGCPPALPTRATQFGVSPRWPRTRVSSLPPFDSSPVTASGRTHGRLMAQMLQPSSLMIVSERFGLESHHRISAGSPLNPASSRSHS